MDVSKLALISIHQWKKNYRFSSLWDSCISFGYGTEDELESFFGLKKDEFRFFKIRSSLSSTNKKLSDLMIDAQFGYVSWIDVYNYIVKKGFKIKPRQKNKEKTKLKKETKENQIIIDFNKEFLSKRRAKTYGKRWRVSKRH